MASLDDFRAAASRAQQLECWDRVDADTLLQAVLDAPAVEGREASLKQLHDVFLALELDSPERTEPDEEPEEEEGDEGTPPPPPKAAKVIPETRHSDALGAILEDTVSRHRRHQAHVRVPGASPNAVDTFPGLPALLAALCVLKSGWGEPSVRYALRCALARSGTPEGAVDEAALWRALCWSTSDEELGPALRTHLRKAWRGCDKVPPPEPEPAEGEAEAAAEGAGEGDEAPAEGGEEEDGGDGRKEEEAAGEAGGEGQPNDGAKAAPPPPPPPRVGIDDILARMQEDPLLVRAWLTEVAIAVGANQEGGSD